MQSYTIGNGIFRIGQGGFVGTGDGGSAGEETAHRPFNIRISGFYCCRIREDLHRGNLIDLGNGLNSIQHGTLFFMADKSQQTGPLQGKIQFCSRPGI